MARSRTSTGVRLLAAAIACLQLGGVAAVAEARLQDRAPARGTDEPRASLRAAEGGDRVVASGAADPQPAGEVTTTTAPPTTAPPTTEAPTTTAAPATTAPPAAPAPAPAPPAPAPPAPAPPADPQARVEAAFAASVPAAWRQAIPTRLEVIDGSTSWATTGGTIQVSASHANGRDEVLRATLAHEFGHLIAFRYGSQAHLGAAPEGWPPHGHRPEEGWADCVSQAMTGLVEPSHGQPPCGGSSLSWTASWLSAGPGAHPRTG